MKKSGSNKKMLDLDRALEQVAQKLRPSANVGCGNTNIYGTRFASIPNQATTCNCYCCSCRVKLQYNKCSVYS